MSRRRGEFEHRTSIFEGAFRAWSHLGGLEPEDLETKSASELDPLTNPLFEKDSRIQKKEKGSKKNNNKDSTKTDTPGGCCGGDDTDTSANIKNNNKGDRQDDGDVSDKNSPSNDKEVENDESLGNDNAESSAGTSVALSSGNSGGKQEYPYEPLPRSGLAHPFVQAILSPWLGPDADQEAIQLGLTTLRTWWQHRRKGESGTARTALGTERMHGVVEGYTRHFFNLAHCLVINDGEQPPRTLHAKMRQLEKIRNKNSPKKSKKNNTNNNSNNNNNKNNNGTSATNSSDRSNSNNANANTDEGTSQLLSANLTPLERLHAAQRQKLHSGNVTSFGPLKNSMKADHTTSTVTSAETILSSSSISPIKLESSAAYGDPNKTPVVFVSENGDIQIAMSIEGITCAHCVKIVETVLRGCNGKKSPIKGLLDAAADRALSAVLIKIDQSSNAKRIAFEAARNLALVGYVAKAKEMNVVDMYSDNGMRGNGSQKLQLNILSTAFEVVASVERAEVFNWHNPCNCPDNGVLREDCPRHSQMNKLIFEAFERRAQQVSDYITGCGKNIDLMTTGQGIVPDTSIIDNSKNLSPNSDIHTPLDTFGSRQVDGDISHQNHHDNSMVNHHMSSEPSGGNSLDSDSVGNITFGSSTMASASLPMRNGRSNSLTSWGSSTRYGRNMSITSENTFGRAMSGLSALSIDWENMDDFDVNVDHSAHINNGGNNSPVNPRGKREDNNSLEPTYHASGDGRPDGATNIQAIESNFMYSVSQQVRPRATRRRSSLKKNIPVDPNDTQNMQVSFQL